MKLRHAAALALVAVPIGGWLVLYFGPVGPYGAALIRLADLPNLLLDVLFNQWMNADNKLFWAVVLSVFPIIAWGTIGFLIAQRK